MNVALQALDRSAPHDHHSHNNSSAVLSKFIKVFSSIDVFCSRNPSVKQYSLYSRRHRSYSRIDYIFISLILVSEIHSADMLPTPLSDHNAVLSKITLLNTPERAARWRFNTTLLFNNDFCNFF